ncbi:MAG: phosphoribosyl-ATP diphosphatase [Hyphomicrobiales bacterium]
MDLSLGSNNSSILPVIIQDYRTSKILDLDYIDIKAIEKTKSENILYIYNRASDAIEMKKTSFYSYCDVVDILESESNDSYIIKVIPKEVLSSNTHKTQWGEKNKVRKLDFLIELEEIIEERKRNPSKESHTTKFLNKGINKIAQKVGEEAVETIIEAKNNNNKLFIEECADLMYYLLVLISAQNLKFEQVCKALKKRHIRKKKVY